MITTSRSSLLVAAAASLGLAACGGDDTEPTAAKRATPTVAATSPTSGRETDGPQPRLVVTDARTGTVTLIDVVSGRRVGTIDAGAVSDPTLAPDGRHVLLAQGDAGRVRVLDSGAWSVPHGDHSHHYSRSAALRPATLRAPDAGHVVGHDGVVAVFADGDGSLTRLEPSALDEGRIVGRRIENGRGHHGVGVAIGDHALLTGASDDLPAEELPDLVHVRGQDGRERQRFDDCPEIHGETATDALVAFACGDGVLLLRRSGERYRARKLAYGDQMPDGTRVYSLHAPSGTDALIGDADHATTGVKSGIVRIDPERGRISTTAVPEDYSYHYAVTADGDAVIADRRGDVHLVDTSAGKITATRRGVTEGYDPEAEDVPLPAVTVAGARAYVTDPASGTVTELAPRDGLEQLRRIKVGGTPGNVVVAGLTPAAGR